ncbi:unnamed protein product [Bemisia tabaci]|uniref:Complex 1 LYR protein domain-containing protein n=1 Tax=Bemisia tabaci TaxID=7038 RepID=A0A9P0F081_BEMTA|nr:unnamed protein product [Bemisia tabaci]
MTVSKSSVLKLYKALIREGSKFPSYNYRMYTLRRVRDAFHENKTTTDPSKIEELYKEGLSNLEIIKRQVVVNQLFRPEKLIIEAEK